MRAYIIVLLIILPPAFVFYFEYLDHPPKRGRWQGDFKLRVRFSGFADGEIRSVSTALLCCEKDADAFHIEPWSGDVVEPFRGEPLQLMVGTGGEFSGRSSTYSQDRFLAVWLQYNDGSKRTITVPIPDNRLTPNRPIEMEVVRGDPVVKVTFGNGKR